jgi:hypothetical protein
MMVLAKRGRAVSPVTSYLAIEPGVRPSTEGLEEIESLGLMGTGTGGGGTGQDTIALGNYGARIFDHQKFLDDLAAKAWTLCGGGTQTASLTLENTRAEVVDVMAVNAPSKKLAHCLSEAAWAFELADPFGAIERQTWNVRVN